MKEKSDSTIILANGSFPKHNNAFSYLTKNNKIICCDGAVDKLKRKNLEPYKIIGDLDSISKEAKLKFKLKTIEESNQNFSDLYKALNWCKENNFTNIVILGATGEREDHMLGNIFLLFDFSLFLNIKMYTDNGVFNLISKSTVFKSFKNQAVSIFSIDKTITINSKNLNYPYKNKSLNNLYEGTLNNSIGNEFEIGLSHGTILVFQQYPN